MSELLHQFHFLRPWWLLALAGLPLLALPRWRRDGGELALSRLVDPDLLPLLVRGQARQHHLPLALFALGWLLATLALAGPAWSRVEQPLYASRPTQVVAISLSRHMLVRDVAPSRLDRARYKAHELLASNRAGLNALIGYAGEAFVVAPLTSDANSLSDLLDAMAPDTMPVDGNDAAAAIALGTKLIHDAKAGGGSLVLITDQADSAADTAARQALAAGVHVSVLGVGTRQGGPIPLPEGGFLRDARRDMVLAARDDATLAALARAGGGRYVPMSADPHDIDALHAQLRKTPKAAASGQLGEQWQDRGAWLLLPLLLIVATAFRRGWLLLLLMVCLPWLPSTAAAGTWQNLWQRQDQQAVQALREGHPKQAQQLARDPAWRGVAAYRAGNYAAAAQDLQHASGSDAAYNRGNALAKARHYQDAIKAYDEALQLDPANVDAKANRKAVEDWLHQQQRKQQPQQNKSDQKKPSGQGEDKPSSAQHDQSKDGKAASQKQKSAQDGSTSSEKQGAGRQGEDKQPPRQDHAGQNHSGEQPKAQTAQERAKQQAQAEQAQQALKKQMDQALAAQPGKSAQKASPHQLGALAQDDPQSKLPADIRHALQRVQDDPGALLRRKFELEYRERHAGAPAEDGQP
ncbi:MAG: tetratricopeptide repeat protein [Rhodanobacter sp.]|nr:MAG: tetratricopeptide repeat protein [Rhodanobacter sp.]TAL93023.1 MAG: tetratricopeptide repeat protein [Rhodanobacter sp.]TAM41939.1 MAG: tetratricopeptide repeat protein [Rhodanobacter sp.]TAN29228.1 MAG: tetratricopeptide repeat protein [Rhodanobacter sp.]